VARAGPLVEQCRALLDTWTLASPVCGLAVAIAATAPAASEQGDLLALGWHDPAAADAAFARLRAELGARAVVRPALRDEHRPERAGAWCEDDGPRAAAPPPRGSALRLLEVPETVEVEWDGDRPCALWWRERRVAIAAAAGPERLSGDWWKDGYARDYWRCDSDSGELLAFREREHWYVQGWYD
jgi:protein ImuB